MTMDPAHQAWQYAEAAREGINQRMYNGAAPHSSTAMSEVMGTDHLGIPGGAEVSLNNGRFALLVVPVPTANKFFASEADTRRALGQPVPEEGSS